MTYRRGQKERANIPLCRALRRSGAIAMQTRIRCLLMSGGTAKGAYFLAQDLPQDAELRDQVLLAIWAHQMSDKLTVLEVEIL